MRRKLALCASVVAAQAASLDDVFIESRIVDNKAALNISANRTISDALRYNLKAIQQSNDGTQTGFLAPDDISINGIKPWQNAIVLDGAQIDSSIDPAGNKRLYKNVWRNPSMGAFGANINASLLKSVEIEDAAISASEGFFMGGLIKSSLIDPQAGTHGQIGLGFSKGERSYIDEKLRKNYHQGWGYIDYSNYLKRRLNASFSHANASGEGILLAASMSDSRIKINDKLDLSPLSMPDIKDQASNFLIKGVVNIRDSRLKAFYIYAPTKTKGYIESVLDSDFVMDYSSHISGIELSSNLGEWQIENKLNASLLNSTRTFSSDAQYAYAASDWANWGSSESASIGGLGTFKQHERKINYRFDANKLIDLESGAMLKIASGAAFNYSDALYHKSAPYQRYGGATALPKDYKCAAGDRTCVNDSSFDGAGQFLSTYERYGDAINKAANRSYAAYLETSYIKDLLELRAGVRAEYDSLSKRIEFAPRLNARYGNDDDFISLGAARYFGKSLLAYELFSDIYGHYEEFERSAPDAEFQRSSKWENDLYKQRLKRPYSDEIALKAGYDLGGFKAEFGYTYRQNKNEIATLSAKELGLGKIDGLGGNYIAYANIARSHAHILNASITSPKLQLAASENEFKLSARYMRKKSQNYSYRDQYLDANVLYNGSLIARKDLPDINFSQPLSLQLSHEMKLGNLQWFNVLNYESSRNLLVRGYNREQRLSTYDDASIPSSLSYDTALSYTKNLRNNQALQLRFGVQNVLNSHIKNGVFKSNGELVYDYAPARTYSFDVSYYF